MKPKFVSFIPAIIWAIVIFILLIIPNNDLPKADFFDLIYFDKWVHAGIFGLLVLLGCFPLFKTIYMELNNFIKITIAIILYGIAMEYVQKFFTVDRAFDVLDMCADAFGAVVAFFWVKARFIRRLRIMQNAEVVQKN